MIFHFESKIFFFEFNFNTIWIREIKSEILIISRLFIFDSNDLRLLLNNYIGTISNDTDDNIDGYECFEFIVFAIQSNASYSCLFDQKIHRNT